jgi:hypothetical protein
MQAIANEVSESQSPPEQQNVEAQIKRSKSLNG